MPENTENFGLNLQEELKNILNAVDHASIIAITDATGVITYVNDRFCEISKYSRTELIGFNHRILKSGHHSERFFKELWKTISTGHIWTGEIKNRAKDGSFYWVFTTIAPAYNLEGKPNKYVSIRFDITEKKRLEEKMNRLKIDLDQAMIEREIREQFLSSLSHDIRTPLTIAKISAQIIEKKFTVTEKIKNLSSKITDNINRVDSLITGLLDESRSFIGQKNNLILEEVDLTKAVSETLENLTTLHGNRFVLEAPPTLVGHWCLSGMKRIIENLVTNAVKYGATDSPITIKIIDYGDQVILSVKNLGNPIPVTEQKIIFEYLKRSSTAELSGQNGWGVGLTVVKGMTEAHGGNVKVQSSPEIDGTIFTVTLPKDSRGHGSFEERAELKNESLVISNECENFLRLFRHMPEVVVILSGAEHRFEFVNESYKEIFGFSAIGLTVADLGESRSSYLPILNEVYTLGMPRHLGKMAIIINEKTRYFNQTFVPRKNNSGDIVGILSISSEVNC